MRLEYSFAFPRTALPSPGGHHLHGPIQQSREVFSWHPGFLQLYPTSTDHKKVAISRRLYFMIWPTPTSASSPYCGVMDECAPKMEGRLLSLAFTFIYERIKIQLEKCYWVEALPSEPWAEFIPHSVASYNKVGLTFLPALPTSGSSILVVSLGINASPHFPLQWENSIIVAWEWAWI